MKPSRHHEDTELKANRGLCDKVKISGKLFSKCQMDWYLLILEFVSIQYIFPYRIQKNTSCGQQLRKNHLQAINLFGGGVLVLLTAHVFWHNNLSMNFFVRPRPHERSQKRGQSLLDDAAAFIFEKRPMTDLKDSKREESLRSDTGSSEISS